MQLEGREGVYGEIRIKNNYKIIICPKTWKYLQNNRKKKIKIKNKKKYNIKKKKKKKQVLRDLDKSCRKL